MTAVFYRKSLKRNRVTLMKIYRLKKLNLFICVRVFLQCYAFLTFKSAEVRIVVKRGRKGQKGVERKKRNCLI